MKLRYPTFIWAVNMALIVYVMVQQEASAISAPMPLLLWFLWVGVCYAFYSWYWMIRNRFTHRRVVKRIKQRIPS